jgi:hypothetical protein
MLKTSTATVEGCGFEHDIECDCNTELINLVETKFCCKTVRFPQEEGLSEVHSLSELEDPNAEKVLRSILEELSISCSRFVSITKGNGSGAGLGRTKLDKERLKLCQREIVSLCSI